MPLVPWHRLVICSHLLLLCGGLLLAFSWSCPLLDPCFCLFWAVLSLPSVCFWSSPWVPLLLAPLCCVFLVVFPPAICGCLLFGLCVPPLVLWGFLVCCWRLPSPADCCLPPPCGCSLVASWSSYCAGPSLWVSGCEGGPDLFVQGSLKGSRRSLPRPPSKGRSLKGRRLKGRLEA